MTCIFTERDHLGGIVREIMFEDRGATGSGGYESAFCVDGRWLTSRSWATYAVHRLNHDIAALRLAGVTGSLWREDGSLMAGLSDPIREAEPSAWERICA